MTDSPKKKMSRRSSVIFDESSNEDSEVKDDEVYYDKEWGRQRRQ